MKNVLLGLALSAFTFGAAANAGSLSDPVIEQDLVATDAATTSMSPAFVLALLTAVLVLATTD